MHKGRDPKITRLHRHTHFCVCSTLNSFQPILLYDSVTTGTNLSVTLPGKCKKINIAVFYTSIYLRIQCIQLKIHCLPSAVGKIFKERPLNWERKNLTRKKTKKNARS